MHPQMRPTDDGQAAITVNYSQSLRFGFPWRLTTGSSNLYDAGEISVSLLDAPPSGSLLAASAPAPCKVAGQREKPELGPLKI